MEEDTTTSTDQEEQAPVESVEEVSTDNTAQPDETQAVQDDEVINTPQTDDSSDDIAWAEKKGIKTDDPKVLLKMIRESEKKMHEATTEAKALRDTVQTVGEDEGLGETSQLLNRLKVTDFYLNNPQARTFDTEMAQIVTEKPYLAEDLDTVYDLARFRSADAKLDEARKSGYKEALNLQAQAETAGPPKASATTRSTPKELTDDDVANMSIEEYKAAKAAGQIVPFAT